MSFIQACVCLRIKAQCLVFQQTGLLLAQIHLCAESKELAVLLCAGKLHARFVQAGAFQPQPNFSYRIWLEAKVVSKGFFLLAIS